MIQELLYQTIGGVLGMTIGVLLIIIIGLVSYIIMLERRLSKVNRDFDRFIDSQIKFSAKRYKLLLKLFGRDDA